MLLHFYSILLVFDNLGDFASKSELKSLKHSFETLRYDRNLDREKFTQLGIVFFCFNKDRQFG
jgi:hypothetical protein